MTTSSERPTETRGLRFSLRALLVAVLVIGALLGLAGRRIYSIWATQALQAELEQRKDATDAILSNAALFPQTQHGTGLTRGMSVSAQHGPTRREWNLAVSSGPAGGPKEVEIEVYIHSEKDRIFPIVVAATSSEANQPFLDALEAEYKSRSWQYEIQRREKTAN